MLNNPILKGFNPDPSIIKVGEDYYIATSTFEWFPSVQIHHSKDLVNWELIGHVLTRKSQINMLGNPDAGGVWAPNLSYHNGTFYVVFTDVKSHIGPFKDTHNYVVTANNIEGPWSDPIYLNSSGFDPSFYHDEDDKTWLINLKWDHRQGTNSFGGIILQQYDKENKTLIGPIYPVFKGTELGLTEGPNLYKKGDYYYLIVAEGGTRYDHAATVARSKSLFGPYHADPNGPLLTSANHPELSLQKAGHASLIETANGDYYIAHLCARPLRPSMRAPLGRETGLQKVNFTADGWLRLENETNQPKVELDMEQQNIKTIEPLDQMDQFEKEQLSVHFSSLREPYDETWISLKEKPNYLRIYGRESLSSKHQQSLVARRQQAHSFTVKTSVTFEPITYQQMAGLIYYYNTNNYLYLAVTYDEDRNKKLLSIMRNDRGAYDEPLGEPLELENKSTHTLKVVVEDESLQFFADTHGDKLEKVGPVLDASKISDDYVEAPYHGKLIDQGFTGAFVGMCVQDLSGRKNHADFSYFTYSEKGNMQ